VAVSIDWGTKVINVPRADMTLIQASPTEIRELNLNSFRLELKSLEESVDGMPMLDTHRHNPPVTVGGVDLARVIEIINGYTITFEDGAYAVNLAGANSNVGDRVNVNQVSIRSANSAGLVTSAGIEAIEYNTQVTIDVINGVEGAVYPIGTLRAPVNNMTDALIIANARGFDRILTLSDLTLGAGVSMSDFTLIGRSMVDTHIVVESAAAVNNVHLETCNITGVLDGGSWIRNCLVGDISYVNGHIDASGLYGTVVLDGDEEAVINNCYTVDQDSPAVIDMGGSGQDLALPNYSGIVTIMNLDSASEEVGVGLNSGMVVLDSSVTAGLVIVAGIGICSNFSTGTTIVNTDGLINKELVTLPTWDIIYVNTTTGTPGTTFPRGTSTYPVSDMIHAKVIADRNKIDKFLIKGDVEITQDYSGYVFEAYSSDLASIDLAGFDVRQCAFKKIAIKGNSTGHFDALNCEFSEGHSSINAHLDNCILAGTFIVDTKLDTDRCSMPTNTIFNLGGTGTLSLANMSGVATIMNATDAGCSLAVTGYYLINLMSTLTHGNALIAGMGILNDYSNGMNVTERTLPSAVWTDSVSTQMVDDLTFVRNIEGGRWKIDGTQMIFYGTDNTTEIARFNLYDSSGNLTDDPALMYERQRV